MIRKKWLALALISGATLFQLNTCLADLGIQVFNAVSAQLVQAVGTALDEALVDNGLG